MSPIIKPHNKEAKEANKLIEKILKISEELYSEEKKKPENNSMIIMKLNDSFKSYAKKLAGLGNIRLLNTILYYYSKALENAKNATQNCFPEVSALECIFDEGFTAKYFFEDDYLKEFFIEKAKLVFDKNKITLYYDMLTQQKKELMEKGELYAAPVALLNSEISRQEAKLYYIREELIAIDSRIASYQDYAESNRFMKSLDGCCYEMESDLSVDSYKPKLSFKRRLSRRTKEHDISSDSFQKDLDEDVASNLYLDYDEKENEEPKDEVQFSVISPRSVNKGEINELYFVMFEEEYEKVIGDIIRKIDGDTNLVLSDKYQVEKGQYKIVMTSFDGSKEEEYINWQGKYKKCCFNLEIPRSYNESLVTINFDVYKEDIRIVNLKCTIIIGKDEDPIVENNKVKRVFLSYSRKDLKEVLRIRQGMEALCIGNEIFLDIIDLVENSDWEKVIKKQIDNSDLFFLVWSKNSSIRGTNGNKTGVEKEFEYALELANKKDDNFFRIIDIDSTPIPDELNKQSDIIAKTDLKAFFSYSKDDEKDKEAISSIVLGMKSLCIGNNINLAAINYDDGCSSIREIDNSSILYLMLSKSSTNDLEVEKEYKYAINKYGLDFVYAIPLEKAENIKIPKLLEKKHLNSTIVYIIDGLN